MNIKLQRYIIISVILLIAVFYIAKSSGPSILRLYVETGLGGSANQPIFAATPQEEINNFPIDTAYLERLLPYNYPNLKILLPKKFTVTKETKIKIYYKKKKPKDRAAAIYLLCKKPAYFLGLFPQAKKLGIKNNYEFITRVMNAKIKEINDMSGAFFVIMKSIFTPDMGNQENLKIVKFEAGNLKGFIAYNLTAEANYFNCDFTDNKDTYYKIYIKDKPISLNLNKVLTIISTANSLDSKENLR